MANPPKDLTDQRFGFLVALKQVGRSKTNRAIWLCRCDCGKEVERESQSLRSKHRPNAKSCGCKHGQAVSKGHSGHMMTGTRPWVIWQLLRRRCRDPEDKDYRNYGGRGIDVCDEWYESFNAFWRDVQAGYDRRLSIDRIDNNRGYFKGNTRWTTAKVQSRNMRTNKHVETPWGVMSVAEAAERANLKYITVYRRFRRGETGEELVRPVTSTTCSTVGRARGSLFVELLGL